MLAGSEGIGGIDFDAPAVAQDIGTVALAIILFSGGLDTHWATMRQVMAPALVLATVGVVITAVVVGTFAWWLLGSFTDIALGSDGVSWTEGLLLGVIVASTDAAAIFALLRRGGSRPHPRTRALLELESGTNDPMAVVLTTAVLGLLTGVSATHVAAAGVDVVLNIVVGAAIGLLGGRAGSVGMARLALPAPGLSPVLAVGIGAVTYGAAEQLHGNGFLAVYLCGLVVGHDLRVNRDMTLQAVDALGWLAQITMFLAMGLLVFPSRLLEVAPAGIAIALVLMFVARPVAVISCLLPFRFRVDEVVYISWAGLKGAVPIVLATFPATVGLAAASEVFSVVFFVVVFSVAAQGLTLGPLATSLHRRGIRARSTARG